MADNEEERKENTSRGNDWEVVSLTASTYAAAPGPRQVEAEKGENDGENDQSELSDDLIKSRHFEAFKSRSDDEILPHDESKSVEKEVGKSSGEKGVDDLIFKGLDVPDEIFGGREFEKKKDVVNDTEFEDGSKEKERDIYGLPAFNDESAAYGENTNTNTTLAEPDPTEMGLDSPTDISQSSMPAKDEKFNESDDVPWWKSKANSLYSHAKEANTFWSIFIAAAVLGIVILGKKKWQQDKWQTVQIKRHLSTDNEKTAKIILPIYRLKDVILGGNPRGSFNRSNANEM